MDEFFEDKRKLCTSCEQEISDDVRYCPHCGSRLKGIDLNNHRQTFDRSIGFAAIFYGLNLLILVVTFILAQSAEEPDMLLVYADIFFILLTLIFSLSMRRELSSLFGVPNRLLLPALLLIIPISYLVFISTDALNESLVEYDEILLYFQGSPYQYLISGVMIVFVPAVFEELAFRGIIQTSLNKIMNENASLLVTAFAFFIIHFSMLSIYWLFPFALLLGWLRKRYNTMIYGMLLHAIHNASVFLMENWEGINENSWFNIG